ncbi:VOC family protein [Streptomyces cavourensis]|uniref:VOC family protein n=1 Tax=Streptomyces cavourensis TaxID=67258 RepID=UPI0020C9BCFA|nr:VOC family protein [Streptomyces cavourensis]
MVRLYRPVGGGAASVLPACAGGQDRQEPGAPRRTGRDRARGFQRVPEGKTAKNRVHLDVRAGTGLVGAERLATLEAERDRLVALGAVCQQVLVADEENESCIVMQDIEGNEFCLD